MNGPNMERRIDLADKTQPQRQGMYDVYYDDQGYATKAILARRSPGYVADDGTVVPGEPIKCANNES